MYAMRCISMMGLTGRRADGLGRRKSRIATCTCISRGARNDGRHRDERAAASGPWRDRTMRGRVRSSCDYDGTGLRCSAPCRTRAPSSRRSARADRRASRRACERARCANDSIPFRSCPQLHHPSQISVPAHNADCESCIAQPPVPPVVQAESLKREKYTWEAPLGDEALLSITIPLVPPAAPVLDAVWVGVVPAVMLNDITHPDAGHPMAAAVFPAVVTLAK